MHTKNFSGKECAQNFIFYVIGVSQDKLEHNPWSFGLAPTKSILVFTPLRGERPHIDSLEQVGPC